MLEAAEIASEAFFDQRQWFLAVAPEDEGAALEELASYRRDNPIEEPQDLAKTPVFGGAEVGVVFYIAVLLLLGGVTRNPEERQFFHSVGAMVSGDVMAGQIHRCVTALTLHVDLQHLLSNLAFGSLFGFMAGRILGGGIAWLTIVVGGAMGNGLNAWMRPPDHISIGASTAVFVALGMMVSHALHPRFLREKSAMRRWSPLIGGSLLMGFIGLGGENTDVGAHVTGFFSGIVLGWLAARLPQRWLSAQSVQVASGAASLAIIAIAWTVAIAF